MALQDHYGPGITGKGHNNTRKLRHAYNKALSAYDVLIMPTLTRTASPLPAENAGPEVRLASLEPFMALLMGVMVSKRGRGTANLWFVNKDRLQ